jgi:hypothetical protein
MPPAIEASIKTKVIQQWLAGDSRTKIAIDNNIGEGTVSSIINYWKIGLDNSDLDSVRELAVDAKKHGLSLSDLASHFRLYNFFRKSAASEEKIESFISKINSSDITPDKVIELVNQLFNVSKEESIPPDQISSYIKQKIDEKQKIEEELREADILLQSKNVSIEAINEHIKLNEELNKNGLSTNDIDKLLNLLLNAKEYGFDYKKIVGKLHNIKQLEKKEKGLRSRCEILSKQAAKYKDILPLTEDIAALHIGIDELIALKTGINEAAKHYNLPPLTATLRLIDDIKKYNKIDGLKRELTALYLQKYALNQACLRNSKAVMTVLKLQSYGITEDMILQLNNFLANNGCKDTK